MPRFLFTCHPADLDDEGLDSAVARLAGEIGVEGIVVDAAAPARTALRPRVTDSPKIASPESAVWFQPDARHYAGTRIRPHVAAAIKSRNLFARICDAAVAQGLIVRARIDLLDSAALAARHPTATRVDLFGRPHESLLCPSHPDVREFAAAVVEDLCANYAIDSIELTHFDFGARPYPTLDCKLPLAAGRDLLNLCLCPSCRQRAGDDFDINAGLRDALSALNEILQLKNAGDSEFSKIIAQSASLAAYVRMRAEAVSSLLKLLRNRCSKPLWVRLHDLHEPLLSGLEISSAMELCDGFTVPPPSRLISPPPDDQRLSAIGADERVAIEVDIHPAACTAPALVAAVHDAAQRGYAAMAFSDYGLLPNPCLDWARQAVRYARRESAV